MERNRGTIAITSAWSDGSGIAQYFYAAASTLTVGAAYPSAPTGWLWSDDFDEWDTLSVGIQIKKTLSPSSYPAGWLTTGAPPTVSFVCIGIMDDAEMAYVKPPNFGDVAGLPGPYIALGSNPAYHLVPLHSIPQFLAVSLNAVGQITLRLSALPGSPDCKPYRRIGYAFALQPSAAAPSSEQHAFAVSCIEHYGRIGSGSY